MVINCVTETASLLVLAGCFLSVGSQVLDKPALNDVFQEAVGSVSLSELIGQSPESGLNSSCLDPVNDYSQLRACLRSQVSVHDDWLVTSLLKSRFV